MHHRTQEAGRGNSPVVYSESWKERILEGPRR
jgi:hypothetical protein